MVFTRVAILFVVSTVLSNRVHAAPSETDPVRRIQVEIRVCDTKDAATNDHVKVSVHDGAWTLLNYPRDDFERNSTFKYDVVTSYNQVSYVSGRITVTKKSIENIGDITRLRLAKDGENGLCIKSIALFVNEGKIYEKSFQDGHWLDNRDRDHRTFEATSAQLRAHPSWTAWSFVTAYGLSISRDWLTHQITTTVAQDITGDDNPAYWRTDDGPAVQVRQGNSTSLHHANFVHVRVSLRVDTPLWPDRNVTIEFDIKLSKKPQGAIEPVPAFDVVNFAGYVEPTWAAWVPGLAIIDAIIAISTSIMANHNKPSGPGKPQLRLCPSSESDGSIVFGACSNVTV